MVAQAKIELFFLNTKKTHQFHSETLYTGSIAKAMVVEGIHQSWCCNQGGPKMKNVPNLCGVAAPCAAALGFAICANALVAAPQTFNVTMTADNAYAIYLGDPISATSLIGGATNTTAGQIFAPESYTLTAPSISSIYIAAWSDDVVKQGLLADFTNITNGGQVLSGGSQWEVTATGINLNTGSPAPTLAALSAQILLANSGSNPSGGWVPVTSSPLDNASGGIHNVTISGIAGQARWMWYDSGLDSSPLAPFSGFNHNEYLIFRIPVIAPSPTTFGCLAMAGVITLRRRRRSGC